FSATRDISACSSPPSVALYRPWNPSCRQSWNTSSTSAPSSESGRANRYCRFWKNSSPPRCPPKISSWSGLRGQSANIGCVELSTDSSRNVTTAYSTSRTSSSAYPACRACCSAAPITCFMCARNDSASAATCRLALSLTVAVSTSCIANASWPRRADGATVDAGAGAGIVRTGMVIQKSCRDPVRSRLEQDQHLDVGTGERIGHVHADLLRLHERVPARTGLADREVLRVDARRECCGRRRHVFQREAGEGALHQLRRELGRAHFHESGHTRDRLGFTDRRAKPKEPARATEAAGVA